MDEHSALMDQAHCVRRELGAGDHAAAMTLLAELVTCLLDDLDVHVEREDLGIFPVSVVTLGVQGWATVDEAHTRSPSFLLDQLMH